MRVFPVLLVSLAACKPSLKGFWTIDTWSVEGGASGAPMSKDDAGSVVWEPGQNLADFGIAWVVLRYTFDPTTGALVPNPEVVVSQTPWAFEEWTPEAPVELVIDAYGYVRTSFLLTDSSSTSMTLDGPSPYGDGTTWSWSLSR